MHLFFQLSMAGLDGVDRIRDWQEHQHMDWGGGTVCREGSFVINEENTPKVLLL